MTDLDAMGNQHAGVPSDEPADALREEVDRLTAELAMSPMADDIAVYAERARILAAVEALPERHAWGDCVTRASVLAAIDGEAT